MTELAGGIALITGAGGTGIGPAVARAFAAAGCAGLCITDINAAALQRTAADLQSRNPSTQVLVVPGDISSAEFVESLFAQVRETFGRLDYAVNVAGIGGSGKTSAESSIEEFDKINGVNYRGLWLCSRQEIGMMQKQEVTKGERGQRGAIVNIASQLGLVGRPAAPAYVASKHAVIGLTRGDAIDCSADRIRVNAVCPGLVDTPMTQGTAGKDGGGEESWKGLTIDQAVNIAPMKRIGRPEEIADVCVFLCSEKASFVQGAAWVVDGGYTIV